MDQEKSVLADSVNSFLSELFTQPDGGFIVQNSPAEFPVGVLFVHPGYADGAFAECANSRFQFSVRVLVFGGCGMSAVWVPRRHNRESSRRKFFLRMENGCSVSWVQGLALRFRLADHNLYQEIMGQIFDLLADGVRGDRIRRGEASFSTEKSCSGIGGGFGAGGKGFYV